MNEKVKCKWCRDGYNILYTAYGHEKAGICTVCNGKGYLDEKDLSREKRIAELLENHFVCEHCGANKIHYRLYGYRCPNHCEDERT